MFNILLRNCYTIIKQNFLFLEHIAGNFLENDFGPSPAPPIIFVHIIIIGHVAAASGPLASPSRGARPPSLS